MNTISFLKTLEETRAEGRTEGRRHALNSYHVISDKGGSFRVKNGLNTICYASLRGVLGEPVVIIDYPHFKDNKTRDALKFWDYLVNRSPFKDVFLTKDVTDIKHNGALIDVSKPANVVLAAMSLGRFPFEYLSVFNSWVGLVDKGVSEDDAVFLCHVFKKDEADRWYREPLSSNHSAFSLGSSSNKVYLSWVEGKPSYEEISFKEKGGYQVGTIQKTYYDIKGGLFSGMKPDKTIKVDLWGRLQEKKVFSSTDAFVKAWTKERKAILKPTEGKKKKKGRVKKGDNWLISQIRKDKGFTLAEVRRIRKELREIFYDDKWDKILINKDMKGNLHLIASFSWDKSPQGYAYWGLIQNRIINGAGYDEKRKLVD